VTPLPRNAAALQARAEAAGWTVVATHNAEHSSVALRMTRGTQRAAAIWTDQKFTGAYVLASLREPATGRSWRMPRRVGAREIAAWVTS